MDVTRTSIRGLELGDLDALYGILEGEGGSALDRESDLVPMSIGDCERMLRSFAASGDGLALTEGDDVRGAFWIEDFSRRHSRARMVLVHDAGSGPETIASWASLAWDHVHDRHNLHRLTSIAPVGTVLETGLLAAGFVREGVLMGDSFHDGRFRDAALMALVREVWP